MDCGCVFYSWAPVSVFLARDWILAKEMWVRNYVCLLQAWSLNTRNPLSPFLFHGNMTTGREKAKSPNHYLEGYLHYSGAHTMWLKKQTLFCSALKIFNFIFCTVARVAIYNINITKYHQEAPLPSMHKLMAWSRVIWFGRFSSKSYIFPTLSYSC